MKHAINIAVLVVLSAVMLSGCWDSEVEKKAKEQEQQSKDFWDMGGPTDRSKSKGYTP
ncbi:hypothetical protein SE916_02160 [Pseudomonas sp. 5FOS]|uniref:Entry exclusion lipoprotein TrbK n=1 Tax=Pseudomonas oryzicola TaxID=485876 RepID=A0ABS6Q4D0_9PSED|nr:MULTISPECIES: hypothetical protein [Pseudomonas]MBV4489061.1 hypothetical protein [Pseudomonas oryzicola]